MNANAIEDLPEKASELDKNIEFICAFYDKCTLPKSDSLCNSFPDFMICPDYEAKRNKLLNEK